MRDGNDAKGERWSEMAVFALVSFSDHWAGGE